MTTTDTRADTKNALLDAAEELFADQGISRASLRAITSKAGANLAAVHYHFGSKQELVRAVFSRRIEPLNDRRMQQLGRVEAEAPADEGPPLERVLWAFLEPVVWMEQTHQAGVQRFKALMGRVYAEPGDFMNRLLREQFEPVVRRFGAAIARAVPHLPPPTVLWRFHFTVGSMVQVAMHGTLIREQSGGLCDPTRPEALLEQLVTFAAAGFRAPVPEADAQAPGPAFPQMSPFPEPIHEGDSLADPDDESEND